MRIAIVYDCLYPHTVGGVERWYHSLAGRLARGHEVTYVTRRQWATSETPGGPPGVRVVAVSGGRRLYTASGRRRIFTPLWFGWGVFWHLLRHRRRYDVVHTCGFPYFSFLAARLAGLAGGPPVIADWVEVWSRAYWTAYLGRLGGRVGAAVQDLCVRLTQHACALSDLQAAHLGEAGYDGEVVILRGIYDAAGSNTAGRDEGREALVVFAGRHLREKGVLAVPAAIAGARQRIPGLRAVIFGDGPERTRVQGEVARLGLTGIVDCPGFAPWKDVDAALRRALCLLLPSQREGYGLVVVEAAARGTPSIVVRGPDNAAVELIDPNENGVIATGAAPAALADAIVEVHRAGAALRERTRAWFARHATRLSVDASVVQLEALYDAARNASRSGGKA